MFISGFHFFNIERKYAHIFEKSFANITHPDQTKNRL